MILFAVFAFTAAMVPRERRAVNTEEEGELPRPQTSTTQKPQEICEPQTPCAWSIYKQINHNIDFNYTNEYCICAPNTTCVITEDDTQANAFVHKCRKPTEERLLEK